MSYRKRRCAVGNTLARRVADPLWPHPGDGESVTGMLMKALFLLLDGAERCGGD